MAFMGSAFCRLLEPLDRRLVARAVAVHKGDRGVGGTATAFRFYRSAGYEQEGPPQHKFGTSASYPMAKSLREDRRCVC